MHLALRKFMAPTAHPATAPCFAFGKKTLRQKTDEPRQDGAKSGQQPETKGRAGYDGMLAGMVAGVRRGGGVR